MGYGPFWKPTLVELLDKYKNLMERTHQKTYSSLDEDFYQVIEETKERLNKFIKA